MNGLFKEFSLRGCACSLFGMGSGNFCYNNHFVFVFIISCRAAKQPDLKEVVNMFFTFNFGDTDAISGYFECKFEVKEL